jgi:hypothetical protein
MDGKKWCMMISVLLVNVFVVSGQLCAMDLVDINNSDKKNKRDDSSSYEDFVNEKHRSRSKRDETRITIPKTPSPTNTSPQESPDKSPDKSPNKSPDGSPKNNSPIVPRLSLQKSESLDKKNSGLGQRNIRESNSQDKSNPRKKLSPMGFSPQKFNPLANGKKVETSSSGDSFSSSSKVVPKDKDHLVQIVKTYSVGIENKNYNETSGLRRRRLINQDNIDNAPVVEAPSKKTYTREDVANILNLYDQQKAQKSADGQQSSGRERDDQLSSRLHEYGVKNGVKLKHLPHYGEMLQNIDVTPEIIEEFAYAGHDFEKKYLQKTMQKMKEQEPEKYEEFIFNFLQAIVNGKDGNSQPDPLVKEQVGSLHKEIDNTKGSLFWSNIGLVIAVLINVGQAVGNIYSGIESGSGNTCNCTTIVNT